MLDIWNITIHRLDDLWWNCGQNLVHVMRWHRTLGMLSCILVTLMVKNGIERKTGGQELILLLGTVTLWSPNMTTPLVKMLCHRGPIKALAIDHAGRYMATSGLDGKLKIWDIRKYDKIDEYYSPRPAATLSISQRGLLGVGWGTHVTVSLGDQRTETMVTDDVLNRFGKMYFGQSKIHRTWITCNLHQLSMIYNLYHMKMFLDSVMPKVYLVSLYRVSWEMCGTSVSNLTCISRCWWTQLWCFGSQSIPDEEAAARSWNTQSFGQASAWDDRVGSWPHWSDDASIQRGNPEKTSWRTRSGWGSQVCQTEEEDQEALEAIRKRCWSEEAWINREVANGERKAGSRQEAAQAVYGFGYLWATAIIIMHLVK